MLRVINPGVIPHRIPDRLQRIARKSANLCRNDPTFALPHSKRINEPADINIYACLYTDDGIGSLGGELCRYFIRKGYRVNIYPSNIAHPGGRLNDRVPGDLKEACKLLYIPAKIVLDTCPPPFSGRSSVPIVEGTPIKYGYYFWEASKLPTEWIRYMNRNKTIFVGSEYNRQIFINNGITSSIINGAHGICFEPRSMIKDDFFTIGFVGTYNKRKNVEGLIRAFQKAFPQEKNVRLKVTGRYNEGRYLESLLPLTRGDERIKLDSGPLSPIVFDRWWDDIDCYCSLSRAEGFGKPSREALSKGIPVIIPNTHSEQELVLAGVAEGIEVEGNVPGHYDFINRSFGTMPDPSIESAAEQLRKMYQLGPDKEKITKGLEWVRQFTWEKCGEVVEKEIYKVKR